MIKKILLGAILLSATLCAKAGVAISGTRFVYEEGKPHLNITLENSDSISYLIKTQVRLPEYVIAEQAGIDPVPFVATPPLFVLAAGKRNKLRIVSDGDGLAQNKESLFDLIITAIPSSRSVTTKDSVQIAVRSHLKLFYRPASLRGNPENAYKQLRWTRYEDGIKVENLTPFYVTFFDVRINGQRMLEPGVIPPFSKQTRDWCNKSPECLISWRSINDFGKILAEQRQKLL